MSQNTYHGYDVRTGVEQTKDFSQNSKYPSKKGQNGRLVWGGLKDGGSIPLWISDFQTGFQISGTTGQSLRTRSFFAHNMVQPVFTVTSQFGDQQRYGNAVELIHSAQRDLTSSMRLYVAPYNSPNKTGRNMRGNHSGIYAEGYVKSAKRRHARFVNAPELTFEFVIERIISGPAGWATQSSAPEKLETWNDIIKGKKFQSDPDGNKPVPSTPNPGGNIIYTDTVGGQRRG